MFFSDPVQTPTGRSVGSYELHLEVSFGCSAFGSVRVRSSVDKYFWLFFSKERSSIVLDLSTTRTLLLSSWFSTTLNIQRWPPLLCWIRQVNSLLLTLSHCSSTQSVLLFKNVSSKQSILNNERLNFFFKLDAPRKKKLIDDTPRSGRTMKPSWGNSSDTWFIVFLSRNWKEQQKQGRNSRDYRAWGGPEISYRPDRDPTCVLPRLPRFTAYFNDKT